MSLVGRVGRKNLRSRIAIGVVYLVLILGALTTLYPFVLMVTTGLKGPTDQNDGKLIPAYLQDEKELLAKYLDDKYAGNASQIASTRLGVDGTPEEIAVYRDFLMQLEPDRWVAGFRMAPNQVTSRLTRRYQAWLRERYRGDIEALNKAYIEESVAFNTVQPPAEGFERKTWKPTPGRKWEEWLEFKQTLPAEYRIPIRVDRLWQEFLRAQTKNNFADVPPHLAGTAKSYEEVRAPNVFEPDLDYSLWGQFLENSIPERLLVNSIEATWMGYLGRRLNPDAPPGVLAVSTRPFPIAADEAQTVREREGPIRREFAVRNYAYVVDYIALNGRALWNTVLFCLLAIGTQLIVNPLAAYALSRYPIRASGKILLFLLATMAFPAEVAMIPSFLLLKDLGLLNTFAALVLPAAASGYMIFLLKGFFDSLPQELFEAGSLDGAKEVTMMTRIALPLSRPVLGYLALLAFMGAYGAFLYAFLIAQDQRMWTLMVFVYQLQNLAPRSVMMAALTLAALPTLVVFLLAQRVIMRGIVLPGER